jgi:hypothetical protein
MRESNAGVRGGLHRTAAVVMIAATLFHFMHLATTKRDRSTIPALLPTVQETEENDAVASDAAPAYGDD